jgi:hypothetical protein
MSTTRSTMNMAQDLVRRLPFGIDTNFAIGNLNLAYRWLNSKGAFVWNVRSTTVAVSVGATSFTIPADADMGKPTFLSGPLTSPGASPVSNLGTSIAYQPYKDFLNFQFQYPTATPGMYSVWTFAATATGGPPPTYGFTGYLLPAAATPTTGTGAFALPFAYHCKPAYNFPTTMEWPLGTNIYFPSPDDFDDALILRAEAEARRIYGLQGWMEITAQSESMVAPLIDQYRSTKEFLSGLVDEVRQTQEINTNRQQ